MSSEAPRPQTPPHCQPPARGKNLLVILCDQLRRAALGCYGDPNVRTPHIDALAARGTRFDNACSTYPICVPFRFSLMTGEYAHTRMVPGIEWRMSPAERTLADEFNEAGYETLYVGKWHLHGGFLHLPGYSAAHEGGRPVPRRYQGRWKHWRGFELRNAPFDTNYFVDDDPTPRPIRKYQTDGLFDIAMDEMRRLSEGDKPFACVLSVEPPHPPYVAPPELEAKWLARDIILPANFQAANDEQRAKWIRHRRLYYAMVENLDQNVGRMTAFLRERKLDERTVVVFLSDHGEMGGSHGLNNKQHPYEESVGIPLMIADPGSGSPARRTVETPVATEDLFPTLLGLVGLKPRNQVPGCDLSPLLREGAAELDRSGVMLQFISERRQSLPYFDRPWRAWRSQRYKYVVAGDLHGATPWLLFDLQDDPLEQRNLIEAAPYQAIAAEHHRALRARLQETDDDYALKPAYDCPGLNLVPSTARSSEA